MMTTYKRHIIKALVILLIVLVIICNFCIVSVGEQKFLIQQNQYKYVYKFSSHYEPYPGLFTSNTCAKCLPPGTCTTQSAGRLGNVIMEYASLWAMARIYNLTAFVPDVMHNRLKKVFSSLSISSEGQFKKSAENKCKPKEYKQAFKSLAKVSQENETLDHVVERSVRNSTPIVLQKCVILVEAIVPLAAEIKTSFTYQEIYSTAAHETLSTVKARVFESQPEVQEVLFIGVHVRRTDYGKQILLLYNSRRPADEGYYGRAIQRLRSQVLPPGGGTEVAQVVTSDDPEWVRSTLLPHLTNIGLRHTFFAGNGDISSPEHDLALLSHCNHSVFAYGTYGMWTALWAGGRTVVYDLDEGDAVSPAMQFAWNLPLWETLK